MKTHSYQSTRIHRIFQIVLVVFISAVLTVGMTTRGSSAFPTQSDENSLESIISVGSPPFPGVTPEPGWQPATMEGDEIRPIPRHSRSVDLPSSAYQKLEYTSGKLAASDVDPAVVTGISGRVTRADNGSALEGVFVWVEGDYYYNYGSTDSGGYYTINIPVGEYTVDVIIDDYAVEYYNNKPTWEGADLVSVYADTITSGIDFALEPGGSITGKVTNTSGTPLADVWVVFSTSSYWALTDANGDYEFRSLPYNLPFYAFTYDSSPYVDEFWQETPFPEFATPLTVNAGNRHLTGINFTLALGGSISGTVTDGASPLSGVYIEVLSVEGGYYAYGMTSASGVYSIGGLPAGDFKVYTVTDGYAYEYYNNQRYWTDANNVSVVANTNTPGIDFVLDPGGSASGTVRDTIGTALADIAVIFEFGGEYWYDCTDAAGQYYFGSIPHDLPFMVIAGPNCGNPNYYQTEYWEEAAAEVDATWLTTTSGTPDITNIDFTLEQVIPTFTDVPPTHPLFDYIEALYAAGYTAGCSTDPLMYCPASIMNRAESAVFMLRGAFGAGYTPNPTPSGILKDDWSPGYWAEKWAEAMYTEGLSAGCSTSPLKYCPWIQLNRQEASVFGLRMMHGMAYVPPAATGTVFADMTDAAFWATKWAEQAYADGLLPECGWSGGKPMFCPNDLVDRGWGAYLVVVAKDLLGP